MSTSLDAQLGVQTRHCMYYAQAGIAWGAGKGHLVLLAFVGEPDKAVAPLSPFRMSDTQARELIDESACYWPHAARFFAD